MPGESTASWDEDVVEAAPISRAVAQRLESEIIRGTFEPRQKLVETELCLRFGVSRSPLREALQLLVNYGLLVKKPRYGVRVAEMSLKNLDDIFTCRVPLEAAAAARIAARPDHGRVARELNEHVDAMADSHNCGDFPAAFDANVALTDALHAYCDNPVLQKLLDSLNKPALRYRYWIYGRSSETIGRMITANRQMVASIGAGDVARTEAITTAMLRRAWADMRKAGAHASFTSRDDSLAEI